MGSIILRNSEHRLDVLRSGVVDQRRCSHDEPASASAIVHEFLAAGLNFVRMTEGQQRIGDVAGYTRRVSQDLLGPPQIHGFKIINNLASPNISQDLNPGTTDTSDSCERPECNPTC